MQPAALDSCRVLELGCSSGGNLLPIAEVYPTSDFVGVDAAGVAINEGKKIVDVCGLQNVNLRQADILDLGDDIGSFDYIICHGVFSWVPDQVRKRILQICGYIRVSQRA